MRNNWLNLRNDKKPFVFPDMYDNSKSWNASFSHLDVIYQLEQTSVIKQGNRLNYKCLHPHSIERQNLKQALKEYSVTPLWLPFEHLDPPTNSFQTGKEHKFLLKCL